MKLLTLKLENFQGIKSAEFKFNGKSTSIYGDNATGKTTVFNAMTWLLFDKSSTGSKNFTPQTKGPKGDLHFLDHSAEGIFSLEDSRIITLKKVYHENYKKKRGSTNQEFSGHSVDFYVDGVPVKEKEYIEVILELCENSERMKMLTMPDYFPEEMAWDERRKILLEICGDVDYKDVIMSDKELLKLNDYLLIPGTKDQHYTVDEFKKIASAKKTDISKQLEEIPDRIDEAQKAIPDFTVINLSATESKDKIKSLEKSKEEFETEKARIISGDNIAVAIRKQIAEANAEIAEARADYATKNSKLNEGTYSAINDIKKQRMSANNSCEDLENEIANATRMANRLTKIRADLLEEYDRIQAETWDPTEEVCPTCKQSLPEDSIQTLRDGFNQNKSNRLEQINSRGKSEASKNMIDAIYIKIKDMEIKEKQEIQVVEGFDQQLAALQKDIQSPKPFEDTEEYRLITARIEIYHKEENNQEGKIEALTAELNGKVDAIRISIQEQEDIKNKMNLAKSQEKRINELSDREKELSGQYEFIEKGIYLCELFVKTKVSLLNERINSKFKCVRFRLFIEQLNGGIKEDCEVMIPSEGGRMVPFVFANNGGRINAGLEIIATLSRHWNLSIPVFVDNAESITDLLAIDNQLIRLVVSAKDKTLRTEIDGEVKTAPKSRGRNK